MPSRQPTRPQPTSIHRIKVTLLRTKPPIWRRFDIDSAATLGELHDAIQASMGWYNSHLHQFTAGGVDYSDPLMELDDVLDEHTVRLADVAPAKGSKLRYQYDFGDDWLHEITVEAVREPDPATRYPVCIAGKLAGPPEDCGGVWGYDALLDTLADPESPDHDELMEWIGGAWDAEAFDIAAANHRIGQWSILMGR